MWKTDNVNLPNNRATALKRFYSMERRFQRDEDFARKYDAVVKEYISLDHARLLTTDELRNRSSKTWYLPHHGVLSQLQLYDESSSCFRRRR
ncbi:Gag Pol polyprotein [Daphnia sinensis]|uniref:Gag Pol polyprotein n=1 Tax=Daphnia sinensis TaxID=1820382 RepID=A0AAD5KTD0_9CRUS|nr:Gag Pol polyprotein [Daphnia sinensis]